MIDLLASFTYEPVQRIGPLSPHGIGTALGYYVGAWLMGRAGERRGIPRAATYNMCTWGALGAIIGARGFYVLAHFGDFASPVDWLKVWEGGLTMFGGFALGLAFGITYMRRNGFHVATTLDAAAPGFVVGVAIGRIGDLVIADHLGKTTTFVLGYQIPPRADLAPGYGPPTYVPGAVVHQTALYDLAGVAVLAGVLWWLSKRRPPVGALFAAFAAWYGFQRFLIDFTRNTDLIESSFFGLSGSQWAGLVFATIGLVALRRTRQPTAEPVEVPGGAPIATEVAVSTEEPLAEHVARPTLEPENVVPPADVSAPEEVPEPLQVEESEHAEQEPPAAEDVPEPGPVAAAVGGTPEPSPAFEFETDVESLTAEEATELAPATEVAVPASEPEVIVPSPDDHPEIEAAFAESRPEPLPPEPARDEFAVLDQVAEELVQDALEERALTALEERSWAQDELPGVQPPVSGDTHPPGEPEAPAEPGDHAGSSDDERDARESTDPGV